MVAVAPNPPVFFQGGYDCFVSPVVSSFLIRRLGWVGANPALFCSRAGRAGVVGLLRSAVNDYGTRNSRAPPPLPPPPAGRPLYLLTEILLYRNMYPFSRSHGTCCYAHAWRYLIQLLERLTDGLTKSSNNFSTETINVRLSSPDVPDLTVVDLPGIIRTSTAGQDPAVIAQVSQLVFCCCKGTRHRKKRGRQ